jgi:chaperonin GroEL
MIKENISNQGEVRSRVLSGIKKMADLIGLTLGPCGQSVIIERGTAEPLIVDDGRRVAENIKLKDPIEQMAVRTCYGVTRKTDEKVGDGTTTSMILTHAILDTISRDNIGVGIGINTNVSELDNRIKESKDEVIKLLDTKTKQIKTEKELKDVASTVAGDEKLGDIIGGMFWQLGKDGHISKEFNLLSEEIETEVVNGYRFSAGYAAPWMITNAIRRDCTVDDVDVLITKQKITDFEELVPISNIVGNSGKRKLLVIARGFGDNVLKHIYQNATRPQQPFVIIGVRAPARQEEAFKDMAIFTGAKFLNDGDDLKLATKEDLGYVHRTEITDDTTILIDGKGKKEDVAKRVKEVEAEANAQKLHQFKADRLERASALSGGVGVIKIGAPTNEERDWLKYKIEDTIYATKQAYKYGIIRGGGLTLKEISEKLPETNILKKALLAPYEKLKANAGGKLDVPKNVFDPVSVEKTALEMACSAVSKLIRIGGAIAYAPTPTLDEAMKKVVGNIQDNEDWDEPNTEVD